MGDDREDPDRDAILKRRHRMIAVALTGLMGGSAQACACLSPPYEPPPDSGIDVGRDAGTDAGARDDAGLSRDGGPLPCLAPLPPDAGPDAAIAGDDAGTMPDAGAEDDGGAMPDAGVPLPCLSPIPSEPE
jgi:hypothetical protein